MKRLLFPLAIIAVCFAAAPAGAQTIGTFRWNIAPFCNVLNLTVTQQGDSFALTGFEESCETSFPRWPVNGTAIIQADGTITLAVTTIFATGAAIHTSATLDATINGTWNDDAENDGTFVFNPTTPTGETRLPPVANTPTDQPSAPSSSRTPFPTNRPPR